MIDNGKIAANGTYEELKDDDLLKQIIKINKNTMKATRDSSPNVRPSENQLIIDTVATEKVRENNEDQEEQGKLQKE